MLKAITPDQYFDDRLVAPEVAPNVVHKELNLTVEEFGDGLLNAVKGYVLGDFTSPARFMVLANNCSVVIICSQQPARCVGTRVLPVLAIQIELIRHTARDARKFIKRFDRHFS